MEIILSKLDVYTKSWASNLTEDDVAHLLQAVYKLPGLLETLQCTKSDKAALIGKDGEVKFAELCQRLPGNYTLQDTSKQGKHGDFVITYSNCGIIRKCLVDIKNYTSSIPKKEIDKFMEDLSFGSYDAGLIISFNTKFSGIAEHLCIQDECLPCGKIPVMYLVSKNEDIILSAVELLISKTFVVDKKNADVDRIESLVETVNNSLTNSSDVRRMLSELQIQIAKSIQKCQENLVTHEAHIKRSVKELSNCVSKIMIDRIIPYIPKIDTRTDNVESISAGLQKNLDPPAKSMAITKIYKSDREIFDELVSLNWNNADYSDDDKNICELTSKNMIAKVIAFKTKTNVVIDFIEALEIPDDAFDHVTHKINKDDSFVCLLDKYLLEFIKIYMNI